MSRSRPTILLFFCALLLLAAAFSGCMGRATWSAADLATLRSLSLQSLPPLPPDPSNAVADDPAAAVLGETLFRDPGMGPGGVSCASCHQDVHAFTDGLARAHGMADFTRNTMPLAGASWSLWQTWDGKADSQWMQALLPLESAAEQGGNRTDIARRLELLAGPEYEALFGPLPPLEDFSRFPASASPLGDKAGRANWESMTPEDRDAINRVFANVGKAIAAFERTLRPASSRFDAYVEAAQANDATRMRQIFTPDEEAGLRHFIGKARCVTCHSGPLLSNFEFHNTAVPPVAGLPLDHGRASALQTMQSSEFNCLGAYSDAEAQECTGLRFLVTEGPTLDGAFRTPSLRNVANTAPYMHAGQFATLEEVVRHYNDGGLQMMGHNELTPLGLTETEIQQLVAFLETLSATDD